MPTLPEEDNEPSRAASAYIQARQAIGRAAGADQRVPLRTVILFAVTLLCLTQAAAPWMQIGLVALFAIAVDSVRPTH